MLNSIEDRYLQQCCDNQFPVSVFLLSGVCLKGKIYDVGEKTIAMQSKTQMASPMGMGGAQLIYKQAIATILVNVEDGFSLSDFEEES